MFKYASVVLPVVALAAAAGLAFYSSNAPAPVPPLARTTETTSGALGSPTAPESPTLPPGHPSIGTWGGSHDAVVPSDEPQATTLAWTAPATWKLTPNPSTMRLATYRIPRAAGDTEDAELSVVRAGGSADANIDRWLGQFDDRGKDTRAVKTIHGMPVTEVEVHGTFVGGGMPMGAASGSHPGWALLAAIVQTPGEPYFFKMTGPTRSVSAARPAFDALMASIIPASP